jgi:hypothetical protein
MGHLLYLLSEFLFCGYKIAKKYQFLSRNCLACQPTTQATNILSMVFNKESVPSSPVTSHTLFIAKQKYRFFCWVRVTRSLVDVFFPELPCMPTDYTGHQYSLDGLLYIFTFSKAILNIDLCLVKTLFKRPFNSYGM